MSYQDIYKLPMKNATSTSNFYAEFNRFWIYK